MIAQFGVIIVLERRGYCIFFPQRENTRFAQIGRTIYCPKAHIIMNKLRKPFVRKLKCSACVGDFVGNNNGFNSFMKIKL